MRGRFEAVVERATGRDVIGFMSANQQGPDIMCEVFILAPTGVHMVARANAGCRATGKRLRLERSPEHVKRVFELAAAAALPFSA